MLQLDNHLFGLKRLKVAISNPPKRRGENELSNRTAGQGSGSSQLKQVGPSKDVTFVRPSFVPSRLKTQDQAE